MELLNTSTGFDNRRQTFGLSTHFVEKIVTGGMWTITTEDSGAVSGADGQGGLATIVTGATLNDETYLAGSNNAFTFTNGKPIYAACRMKYSEPSGLLAAVAFGLMSSPNAADQIVDGGAGLKSSYSGAMFFKKNGGTNWNVETSVGSTRTGTVELTALNSLNKIAQAAPDTNLHWLEVSVIPVNATQARADFFIDSVQVYSILFTYTGSANMTVCLLTKCGDGNALTVTADFLGAEQKL